MYKRFEFEGDIHDSLACVPLTVRRKLDLAALKISLAGWQQLARDERLCLCHLGVDSADEIAVYREVMQAFCARRSVALKDIDDPAVTSRPWNAPVPPAALRARTGELGAALDDEAWSKLDEESRYALVKLADPKRTPEKLAAALGELGLLAGHPAVSPDAARCEAMAPADDTSRHP
jgi:hypothetical protein